MFQQEWIGKMLLDDMQKMSNVIAVDKRMVDPKGERSNFAPYLPTNFADTKNRNIRGR